MTERTLARYSQKELGMSLKRSRRQRLKSHESYKSMLTKGKRHESTRTGFGLRQCIGLY